MAGKLTTGNIIGIEKLHIVGGAEDRTAITNGNVAKNKPLVVCFGELLIDFVLTVGGVSLAEAPAFKKAPGGAPANVAVGVGDDEFGYMFADILKQNNVDNSGMRFDRTARTVLAFVTLKADGEREFMFFHHPSADMRLHESELNTNLIKQANIFHYGSISLIEEPCKSVHLAAMNIAKKSGSMLSYDPNLRLPLWPSPEAARKGIMSIWDQSDIIKKLFHPNLKLLVVTEGSEGCRYYTKEDLRCISGIVKTQDLSSRNANNLVDDRQDL
ncbi:hypothetical protein GOBAR_DD14711 [Gossypium barbadense]|nr:hypothetical protein GOBAR_DD14711 [Gossypium barbadense]